MNSFAETDTDRPGEAATRVVVYKLGGSLLDLPDLAHRFRRVLASRPEALPLVVVGGGRSADIVREWDRVHHLEDEAAHWLALRAMQLNERLLTALLPEATIVEDRPQAREAWNANRIAVLSTFDFLTSEERELATLSDDDPSMTLMSLRHLPHCWDVTSDSIAAWIALRWPASELILLKSTNEPENWRNATTDFVDPMFARMTCDTLKVTAFNLRDA
jgi:aspartokinase-like uncharacterized kinase